jgi:hypothetical protein
MDAINLFTPGHGQVAVFQHQVHPQMRRPQFGDEWWIEDVANRGMAILTETRASSEQRAGCDVPGECAHHRARKRELHHLGEAAMRGSALVRQWSEFSQRRLLARWCSR